MNRSEYQAQYYLDNKKRLILQKKEKTTCDCGATVTYSNMAKHLKTKKHLDKIKGNEKPDKALCICGMIVKLSYYNRHLKTKKHSERME